MDKKFQQNLTLAFFLLLFAGSFFLLARLLWPFIAVIVLAFVVTGLFMPLQAYLCRRIKPSLASLLTCLLIVLIVFVPISFFAGVIAGEAHNLYLTAKTAVQQDTFKDLIRNNRIIETVNPLLAKFNISISGDTLNSLTSEVGRVVGLFLYEQARSITANILGFVFDLFLMILVVYYLLIDGDRLMQYIIRLSPLPDDQDRRLISKFKDMSGAILIGNGLGGLIQGTLGGIVFALFGLQSPFLWGTVMAILAFLPIVGIGVVFVPAAVLLLLKGRIAAAVFFIVFYMILSGCIEYFFKPRLVGRRVQMHTLLVFLAIIGGLSLFGILGIIYGPLIVTAFLTLSEIYSAQYRHRVDATEVPSG